MTAAIFALLGVLLQSLLQMVSAGRELRARRQDLLLNKQIETYAKVIQELSMAPWSIHDVAREPPEEGWRFSAQHTQAEISRMEQALDAERGNVEAFLPSPSVEAFREFERQLTRVSLQISDALRAKTRIPVRPIHGELDSMRKELVTQLRADMLPSLHGGLGARIKRRR